MLKKYHPEDDPEGYQRLREAFDEAMKLAKQKGIFPDDEDTAEREAEAAEEEDEVWEEERTLQPLEFQVFERFGRAGAAATREIVPGACR